MQKQVYPARRWSKIGFGGGFLKNHDLMKRLKGFVMGKGFYIALVLCAAAIGTTSYCIYNVTTKPDTPPAPVGGHALVELPDDPEANLPVLPPQPPKPDKPETKDKQPDKPKAEPKQEPPKEEPKQEKKQEPVVYTWPVKGEVLREFSVETLLPDPTMGDWRTHRGLDIAAPAGAQVLVMGAGQVKEVYEDGLMGTTVVVEHSDGMTSVYCGLGAEVPVAVGEKVETGAVLGNVENTAIAESGVESHLHLETWRAGEPIDPTFYLPLR